VSHGPYIAGACVLAVQAAMACTAPALFTFQPPIIVHPPSPAPVAEVDGGWVMVVDAADADPYTPPAQIYAATQVCARLAAISCSEGLSPLCGWATAPLVDGACVLAATTVDQVRRCRGVVCP
jgi:hypothetical protein